MEKWIVMMCITTGFLPAVVQAQSGNLSIQQQRIEQVLVQQQEQRQDFDPEEDQLRQQAAEENFDAIVVPQNAMPVGHRSPIMMDKSEVMTEKARGTREAPAKARVKMPLLDFARQRDRIEQHDRQMALRQGPAVVLGESEYVGRATKGALELNLTLKVTLGRSGEWKMVPLVGDGVVLANASVAGEPIPVSRRNGYHVWVTRKTGEMQIDARLLIPARGPRGSIEYDFLVARTPITRFRCQFPVPGLEPRMAVAVSAQTEASAGGTLFMATLRPTARIHLIGFRDLGEEDQKTAKMYAESLNLLSVDENKLEVFSVFRYTILYAGAKAFQIAIPKGFQVVSADGMGAFHYELEDQEGGQVLKGETAFPIRNNYEVSLRLKREMEKDIGSFRAPLPRCLGVERESGWLGLEVPGKLRLEEKDRQDVLPVDVRQLPEEMVRSAVSPILKAYRYHTPSARVEMNAMRLPELEPVGGSVDRVRAHTRVTVEGKQVTDYRITLRNRDRHHLLIKLPESSHVTSANLDGQPVNPSRDEQGRLLLPLKRSEGGDRMRPFTASVIVEEQLDALGLFGAEELTLPAVDLPVSSLVWTVYLPPRNSYSSLKSDIEKQAYLGHATWQEGSAVAGSIGRGHFGNEYSDSSVSGSPTADAGAMPVRFTLPKDGKKLTHERYWLVADQPIRVSFAYLRTWLLTPLWLLLAILAALGLIFAGPLFRAQPGGWRAWTGLGLAVVCAVAAWFVAGILAVFVLLLLWLLVVVVRSHPVASVRAALQAWSVEFSGKWHERERDPLAFGWRQVVWKGIIGLGIGALSLILLGGVLELLLLLANPLGG